MDHEQIIAIARQLKQFIDLCQAQEEVVFDAIGGLSLCLKRFWEPDNFNETNQKQLEQAKKRFLEYLDNEETFNRLYSPTVDTLTLRQLRNNLSEFFSVALGIRSWGCYNNDSIKAKDVALISKATLFLITSEFLRSFDEVSTSSEITPTEIMIPEHTLTTWEKLAPSTKQNTSSTDPIDIDTFFLKAEGMYKPMYEEAQMFSELTEAQKRSKGIDPKKHFPKPVEQLSPQGLMIMSHLYAEKDKSQRQPLIASSVEDFKKFIQLMDDASIGTEVTVILQPSTLRGEMTRLFQAGHKSVFKMRKTDTGLQIANMDSTPNDRPGKTGFSWAKEALQEHAVAQNRAITPLISSMPIPDQDFSRQSNKYECGIFATKDARQINRDILFLEKAMRTKSTTEGVDCQYEMTPEYFKGIQSNRYGQQKLKTSYEGKTYGEHISNRKKMSLQAIRDKHKDAYIHYFSHKFHDSVMQFVKKHRDNPAEIQAIVDRYDAGKITPEALEQRYGLVATKNDLRHTQETTLILSMTPSTPSKKPHPATKPPSPTP